MIPVRDDLEGIHTLEHKQKQPDEEHPVLFSVTIVLPNLA